MSEIWRHGDPGRQLPATTTDEDIAILSVSFMRDGVEYGAVHDGGPAGVVGSHVIDGPCPCGAAAPVEIEPWPDEDDE